MTPQEAIEILEVNVICSPKATKFKEGVEVAKKALEKQIPKKPVLRQTPQNAKFKLVEYECPECHSWKPRGTNYCSKCGQALDWSDTE